MTISGGVVGGVKAFSDGRHTYFPAYTNEPSIPCPICLGMGWITRVELNADPNGYGTGSAWNETCKDCGGAGWVRRA